MRFNILLHNHGNFDCHTVRYLRESLSVCGHEVTVSVNNVANDGINIYFECFFDDFAWAEYFDEMRNQHGARVGILTTELMIGGTFPYRQYGINSPPEIITKRLTGFYKAVPKVDFVWSFLERTALDLEGQTPINEIYPYGAFPLVPAERRRSPKDIDVVFFGKKTPHRDAVLRNMASKGIGVVAVGSGFPMGMVLSSILESLIDRSKIVLNLTLHDVDTTQGDIDPRFVSCDRVSKVLSRSTLMVSEDIPFDNPYSPYMVQASTEDLAQTCRDILTDGSWAELGETYAENFAKEMDVKKICGPVIDRTLAAMGIEG